MEKKINNNYYVYEWIRLDTNEPFYVGKGKGNRCYKLTRQNNHHFNNIVKTIPVAVNILHDNLEEDVAFDLECYYIWLYRDEVGYNLCNINDGGEGNVLIGELNGMYGKRGEDNPNYGRHHSDISKRKMSESRKGKKLTDSHKKKLSDAFSGENNPMFNKMHSEESKNKIRKSRKGKMTGLDHWRHKFVICLTTMQIFCTLTSASKYYNLNKSHLTTCCKGYTIKKGKILKRNYCGKLPDGTPLKWMYLDDFLNKCTYTSL